MKFSFVFSFVSQQASGFAISSLALLSHSSPVRFVEIVVVQRVVASFLSEWSGSVAVVLGAALYL